MITVDEPYDVEHIYEYMVVFEQKFQTVLYYYVYVR